ncbi:MAG: Nif11-like leader peptide family natural product precursor [Desulfobacterales bacterium]|nr:Nif11-like leader peptide family natural product precursor [Desulfobacterales bacterium]
MSKKNVEEFLIAGGEDHKLRARYDVIKTREEFVALANTDDYDFTIEEFDDVLRESGDSFDLIGNPAKRQIWWV